MTKWLLCAPMLILFLLSASAQKKANYFDLLSYHISLSDYTSFSNNKTLNSEPWYSVKGKSMGFGINAWKNIKRNIDISGGLNITFSSFPAGFVRNDSIGQGKISTQLDVLAHLFATPSTAAIRPFLTAGIGAGIFPNQRALLAPVGTGLQINFKEGARLIIQAQLRNKLSKGITESFLFYHIGVAQSLARSKKKKENVEKSSKVILPKPPADADYDGIPDIDDLCPTEKGTINGCPDRDGDLIPDQNDDCPDEPGTIKGCPDNDGDNITNKLDSCPDVAGIIKYNGCPIPDTDGDGINDDEDKCPKEVGVEVNNGCPEIKEEIKQKVNYSAQNIFFRFGSATLRSASFRPLNELIKILKDNPTLKLKIEAHTDSIGIDINNMQLSENRAKAVADYLIKKGISSERITSIGYGETRPIADNSTEKGRSQNRRVEFILGYE